MKKPNSERSKSIIKDRNEGGQIAIKGTPTFKRTRTPWACKGCGHINRVFRVQCVSCTRSRRVLNCDLNVAVKQGESK